MIELHEIVQKVIWRWDNYIDQQQHFNLNEGDTFLKLQTLEHYFSFIAFLLLLTEVFTKFPHQAYLFQTTLEFLFK